jgi:uncharacterized OsmC-like protein
MYARTKGWQLGTVEVEIDYDPGADPRRCSIIVHTGLPLSVERVGRLEKVAATCPVRRALEGGVEFAERVEPQRLPLLRAAG